MEKQGEDSIFCKRNVAIYRYNFHRYQMIVWTFSIDPLCYACKESIDRYNNMLYESEVISAVCNNLEAQDFEIRQQLSENEKGEDIIAMSSRGLKVFIEAKGETSSKQHTKRFGKPFTRAQRRVHVAEAFLRAAQILQNNGTEIKVGIAFPNSRIHREFVNSIRMSLDKLGITVFYVNDNRTVEVVNNW